MHATKLDNKEIIRRVIEAGNKHDLDAVAEFIAPKSTIHSLFDATDPLTNKPIERDREYELSDMGKYDSYERENFPQEHTTIDEIFDIGNDKVLSITTTTGTHKSGKKVSFMGMYIDRIEDGKIVETWALWDRLGYWQQLGMVPKTSELLKKLDEMKSSG